MAAANPEQPDEEQVEVEQGPNLSFMYPIIKKCDMSEEDRNDATEMIITACEKYSPNYDQAAKVIKETMNARYGVHWHCVVGEGYSFQVGYETGNILYLYFGGNLGIVTWKCP